MRYFENYKHFHRDNIVIHHAHLEFKQYFQHIKYFEQYFRGVYILTIKGFLSPSWYFETSLTLKTQMVF
jgi:hypothetical protein